MFLSFHGASRTVTGSKHLIRLKSGRTILLDCGLFQGHGPETIGLNRHFGFDPRKVDFLLLSHAHIDHSGNIPHLVKQGFKGKIYCTSATRDLCAIMLADAAHIQEYDAQYINSKRRASGREEIKPLYTIDDVHKAMELFYTVPFNHSCKIADEIEFTFYHSGHILGAAGIFLTLYEGNQRSRLFFTGDIGRPTDKILKAPAPFPQCDYLICESTYGDRLHDSTEKTEQQLLEIVKETCVDNKGKLIIPAFSLGRTQEIVYSLNNLSNARKLPPIQVYVDSPLSVNATAIMGAHHECFNDSMLASLRKDPSPFGFERLHYTQRVEDSIRLNDLNDPMIIISASGMAEAGRIKHHIKNNVEKSNCTILIVGYCTPGSLAGRLLNGAEEVSIFSKSYKVKARVEVMNSYSAHADYSEMLHYLACQQPEEVRKVFLVHGDYEAQLSWQEKLAKQGFRTIEIPELHSEYELP